MSVASINCTKMLVQHRQIAGTPLEPLIPKLNGNIYPAQKKLGYGDNLKDWAISSQALLLYTNKAMRAVQRLDVGGFHESEA